MARTPRRPASRGSRPDAVLVAATDELTDALDSAADILHRQLSTDENDDSVRPGPELAGA